MRLVLLFIVALVTAINLNAYSYAAAGKEPTIDAKEAILKAISSDDFDGAKKIFEEHSKNYKYLNDEFSSSLFLGLENAIKSKDKTQIVKYLNISIASEIQRRLDGGLKNINQFNIAKVMLAKANKFYKILSVSLDKQTDEKLKIAIKNCVNAIGNPGLFGVGAKPKNEEVYIKNQKLAVEILKSL